MILFDLRLLRPENIRINMIGELAGIDRGGTPFSEHLGAPIFDTVLYSV